jgi:hypothetical protein
LPRKLSEAEKNQIAAKRLETEREAFPEAGIEVIVADYTYANGEPKVRVVRQANKTSAQHRM